MKNIYKGFSIHVFLKKYLATCTHKRWKICNERRITAFYEKRDEKAKFTNAMINFFETTYNKFVKIGFSIYLFIQSYFFCMSSIFPVLFFVFCFHSGLKLITSLYKRPDFKTLKLFTMMGRKYLF